MKALFESPFSTTCHGTDIASQLNCRFGSQMKRHCDSPVLGMEMALPAFVESSHSLPRMGHIALVFSNIHSSSPNQSRQVGTLLNKLDNKKYLIGFVKMKFEIFIYL